MIDFTAYLEEEAGFYFPKGDYGVFHGVLDNLISRTDAHGASMLRSKKRKALFELAEITQLEQEVTRIEASEALEAKLADGNPVVDADVVQFGIFLEVYRHVVTSGLTRKALAKRITFPNLLTFREQVWVPERKLGEEWKETVQGWRERKIGQAKRQGDLWGVQSEGNLLRKYPSAFNILDQFCQNS